MDGGPGSPGRPMRGLYLQWSAGPAGAGSPSWPCTAARWPRRTGVSSRHIRRLPRRLRTRGHAHSLAAPPQARLPLHSRARTQQHHQVPEFQRSALPSPDPLHLGHPGPPALQYGELLVAGSRSADTHTSPGLLPGPPSGPQGQEHSCQSGQAHRLGDRQNAWWDCSSTRVRA